MTGDRWAVIALIAVGVLAFANGLANPFVMDEQLLIVRNPALKADSPWVLLTTPFFPQAWMRSETTYQRYRPLTMLSFWLDYRLWGLRPVGYHLTNLTLHLTNGWLLYRVAVAVSLPPLAGATAAILWLIHPIHPEAVTYIPSRGTVLAGTAGLLLVLLHVGWRRRGRLTKPVLAAEGLALALALLASETAIVLPLILWAYERVAGARDGSSSLADPSLAGAEPSLRQEAAALGLVLVGYLALRLAVAPPGKIGWGPGVPLSQQFQAFGQTMTTYLRWLLMPTEIRFPVSLDPQFPLWGGLAWCGLAVAGGWLFWSGRLCSTIPAARWGLLWTGIALLPFAQLGLQPSPPIAPHYLYGPAMGLALAAGALAAQGFSRLTPAVARRLAWGGLLVIGAGWMAQTLALNRWWGQPAAIYRGFVEAGPPFATAGYRMLAVHHLSRGAPQRALLMTEEAVRLDPAAADPHALAGIAYERLGRVAEAEAAYRRALARNPALAPAYLGLATLAMRRGELAEAFVAAQRAVEVEPDFAEGYATLGKLWWQMGYPERAIESLQQAITLQPDLPAWRAALEQKQRRR